MPMGIKALSIIAVLPRHFGRSEFNIAIGAECLIVGIAMQIIVGLACNYHVNIHFPWQPVLLQNAFKPDFT
jgi:hypothetical protein